MKNLYHFYAVFILLTLFSCNTATKKGGDLRLNSLFSNHMVLQQKADVNIWGTYLSDKKITIKPSWGDEIYTNTTGEGKWIAMIKTPKAGGPYSIEVKSDNKSVTITDVFIGEVWLASGQSNMEMPLKGWPPNDMILNYENEIKNANEPTIRMFTVERSMSHTPLDTIKGEWKVSNSANAANFSATAYFFAKKIQKELNVPVGIIHSSWGGSPIESWTSSNALKKLGYFSELLEELNDVDSIEKINNWFNNKNVKAIPKTGDEWKATEFYNESIIKTEINDAQWNSVTLPARFDFIRTEKLDGIVWLKKDVVINNTDTDYELYIGAVDDMDITYFNGTRVGELLGGGFWNTPRKYTIPKSLIKEGRNTIDIIAVDTGGPGGVSGDMTLTNTKGDSILINGDWKHKLLGEIYNNKIYQYDSKLNLKDRPNMLGFRYNTPTVLFNGMINPLTNFTIKGAIWYQGEANVGRSEQYEVLFPAFIKDWRTQWGYDFPFYYAQIAPYIYNTDVKNQVSQKVRDAQRKTLKVNQTGMAVTLDIGDAKNIHPANKQDVGKRLALIALANDYGKEIVYSGPLFKNVTKKDNALVVDFDHIGSGLTTFKKELIGFEIAGADKVFVTAKAKIVNDKIEVFNKDIASPKYVRYAWRDDSIATLFNMEGLPASSFSSED